MKELSRREAIQGIGVGVAAMIIGSLPTNAQTNLKRDAERTLRYNSDGTFKLQVLCDLHYNPSRDEDSLKMVGRWLDDEKPDLVIVAGDCIAMADPSCTPEQVKTVIASVGENMEKRQIPWGVTFGNHDPEQSVYSGMTKDKMIEVYSAFPHNVNKNWTKGIAGVGNQHLLIWDEKGQKPLHCIWLLDSGDCLNPLKGYQMHADQIEWYSRTSIELERKYKGKIPGTMLFHIPIPEYAELARTKKFVGARNEEECTPSINSGLLAAIIDRGDVKTICCGHDHVNNYLGDWRGVHLAYAGVSGFHTYPDNSSPDNSANDKCRCSRVYVFNESEPNGFKTWIRFKDNTTREDLPQPDAA